MKKVNVLSICIIPILLFSTIQAIPINAATENKQTITKEKEFTSKDKEPEYDGFTTVISENGSQYELKDIEYTNNGTVESGKTVTKTTTKTLTGLNSKSYSIGQTDTINDNGKKYTATITNISYEENTEGNRWGEVSGSKDYGLQTDKPTPPNTMALSYYDGGTGQTLTIDAHLTELEQTSSEWQYYSYIDIEVSNYTDSKYMFEGDVINNNGSTVLPEKYYSKLLSLAGMNDGDHRISSIYWLGEPYKNGPGKNRQARADIQAYSASYTAHYYEKFSLDGITTYGATIEYEYEAPVEDDQPIYQYTATATYTLIVKSTEAPKVKEKAKVETETVVKTITTLSLLLVLCAGFVILVMFLLTKLKLRKKDFYKLKKKK